MLRCNNCGWFNVDGTRFCEMCGEPLTENDHVEVPAPEEPAKKEAAEPSKKKKVPAELKGTIRAVPSSGKKAPAPVKEPSEEDDFCPMCGYPLSVAYTECPNCGYVLSDVEGKAEEPAPAPIPAPSPATAPASPVSKATVALASEPAPAPKKNLPKGTVLEQAPVQAPIPEPAPEPEPIPEPVAEPEPEPAAPVAVPIASKTVFEPSPAPAPGPEPEPEPRPTVAESFKSTVRDFRTMSASHADDSSSSPVASTAKEEHSPEVYKRTIREIPGRISATVSGEPLMEQRYKRTVREVPQMDGAKGKPASLSLIPLNRKDAVVKLIPGEVIEIAGHRYLVHE